jgi:hypothetical protein
MDSKDKSIAIMQPYIFPYLGYFQLIQAVDKFIFYDDVNFIKRGWINRNRVLINNEPSLFTIPLIKASQNRLINETKVAIDKKWLKNFYNTIELSYKKAPFFLKVNNLIKEILNKNHTNISELASESIIMISKYLDINTEFELSSKNYSSSKGLDKADRLIEICNRNDAKSYINAHGGIDLYDKDYFRKNNIELYFHVPDLLPYKQFNSDFISGLSIIDILMFNNKDDIQRMLSNYKLI